MSSPLKVLEPLFHLLPEVKSPTSPPTFSQKLVWTLLALAIFYAMYNVAAVGVSSRLAGSSAHRTTRVQKAMAGFGNCLVQQNQRFRCR